MNVCAKEGELCGFAGTKMVKYGAKGSYNYRSANNGILCSNKVFGDPLYGVHKKCSIVPDLNLSSPCAKEGGVCSFNGKRRILYGAKGKFNTKTATNSIKCSYKTFGDPIKGVSKSCYISTPYVTQKKLKGMSTSNSASNSTNKDVSKGTSNSTSNSTNKDVSKGTSNSTNTDVSKSMSNSTSTDVSKGTSNSTNTDMSKGSTGPGLTLMKKEMLVDNGVGKAPISLPPIETYPDIKNFVLKSEAKQSMSRSAGNIKNHPEYKALLRKYLKQNRNYVANRADIHHHPDIKKYILKSDVKVMHKDIRTLIKALKRYATKDKNGKYIPCYKCTDKFYVL